MSIIKMISLSFFLCIFSSPIFSQVKKQPKFGKISKAQLEKKADEKFPDAHAVVLFDYGDTYYRFLPAGGGLRVNFQRHIAIQFFDNTMFDLATFEEYLQHNNSAKEVLNRVKGVTYNLVDGKIKKTKFSKKDIIKEEISKTLDVKKITMPNVREGSIIELRYEVASDYYRYINPWEFQRIGAPTRYSEYNMEIPEFYSFNKSFVGAYYPHIKEVQKSPSKEGDFLVFNQGWVMTDIPEFTEEDYMRDASNYICRIDFEVKSFQFPGYKTEYYTRNWDDIKKDMMDDTRFGRQLKKKGVKKDIVAQFDGPNDMEKLVKIYEHVKTSMKWNGDMSVISRDGINDAWKAGSGNSGDINLTLIAALKAAGYEVSPVVLSTRNRKMLPVSAPSIKNLNYVLAAVQLDDKTYYLDATDDLLPAFALPIHCFNGQAIVLEKEKTKKVMFEPNQKYRYVTQNKLKLDEEGMLSGVVKKVKSGYAAMSFRRGLSKATSEEAFIEEMENDNEGMEIESHTFENINNIYKDSKEEYSVNIEDKVEDAGDLMYLNPMLYSGYDENPFKLEKRQYPVDFAVPLDYTYMLVLEIPEGFAAETLPEAAKIALPNKGGSFTHSAKVKGNTITILSRMKINQTIFTEGEYPVLKQFYDLIVKSHAEQIVLKKM